MKILARVAAAILVAAALSSASPGWLQAQPTPGWLPPDLSNDERQEWKEGRPPGWSRGVKRGWRGKDCPPGLAKKGRCHPREVALAPQGEQKKWEDQVREAITRALAYGAERSAPLGDLESFAQQGLSRGAAAEAIALGIYRLAAESRR